MIVLGIDTSGYQNAVGIADGDTVLADFNYEARNSSLRQIITHLETVLGEARLKLEDIGGIGVGLGPGSWTGIRIGVTVAKMLAYATGIPLAGVPTLEALAIDVSGAAPVCAVVGAGTGDMVYAAVYDGSAGILSRVGEYYTGDIAGLTSLITGPSVCVVSGLKYDGGQRERLERIPGYLRLIDAAPGGAAVARLAARRLQRGERDDVLSLSPLYLKESTARAFQSRRVRVAGQE